MNIISIDPSLTSTGIFINKGRKNLTISTAKLKSEKEKYNYIRECFEVIIDENKIGLCLMEDYGYSTQRMKTQAEVKGIILSIMYKNDIPVMKIPINTWKSLIDYLPDEKDKKKKKPYMQKINEHYKKEFKSTDECDAYLIMRACYLAYQGACKIESHLLLQRKLKAMGELF
jgi:hypothetical protein